ncbi:hypothetical protein H0H92_014794, partial [Tricholoma furcatifolium]
MDDDYSPFPDRAHFEFGEFLYSHVQMSAPKIDRLLHILKCMCPTEGPQVSSTLEIYKMIDEIQNGDVPWDSFSITYNGPHTVGVRTVPPWMTDTYDIWFRDPLTIFENQIGNPDFKNEIDMAPKRVFDVKGKRRYRDVMSGNWAWSQCDKLAENPDNHGA